jgi:ribosomal protein S18 acetylase RimI-like enzyme|tara:strand:+ start:1690 stop:2529 length:840 start_codon:yes stop_codon:yes gene_type:complete
MSLAHFLAWSAVAFQTPLGYPRTSVLGSCRRTGLASCSATADVQISKARNEGDLRDASHFFVNAFWSASTSTESAPALSENQRGELARMQLIDMEERYSELVGTRRLKSTLLIARMDDEIVGCCGCELAVVERAAMRVLPRSKGEAIFKNAFAELGGRARNELRKASLQELSARLLPPGFEVQPVLSNLACDPSRRGTGLGRVLCERCEDASLEWGYDSILLQVEECNNAGRKLYEKLGYTEAWNDGDATATRVQTEGGKLELVSVPTSLIGLSKPLSG